MNDAQRGETPRIEGAPGVSTEEPLSPEADDANRQEETDDVGKNKDDTGTDVTTDSVGEVEKRRPSAGPVVSTNKRSRPPYKYDPSKITLRFLFANRDGLTVTIECEPSDTVGEVKGALLSVWPEGTLRFVW
jgi:hypothetical protein